MLCWNQIDNQIVNKEHTPIASNGYDNDNVKRKGRNKDKQASASNKNTEANFQEQNIHQSSNQMEIEEQMPNTSKQVITSNTHTGNINAMGTSDTKQREEQESVKRKIN